MASRQEEKERLRKEREAQQAKDASAAARARMFQLIGGGVLVLAIAGVVVLLLVGGGGGGSDKSSGPPPASLQKTAAAAGCVVRSFKSEGRTHTTGKVVYKTNPPTSGNHYPVPAEDGIYDAGNTPPVTHVVHALEHGRIELQYKQGTTTAVQKQLEGLFDQPFKGTPGYHELLFENTTNMPYAVAASAWTHLLACKTYNAAKFPAAYNAFRQQYTDKGPEFIP